MYYKGVNALNGLFPFLRYNGNLFDMNVRCQRPKRALSISTVDKLIKYNCVVCVNALNGLFPFLHLKTECYEGTPFVCQRPKRALSISTLYME